MGTFSLSDPLDSYQVSWDFVSPRVVKGAEMVVIRLARFGTSHSPRYRITVADQRNCRDGKFIEVLGFYNPQARGKAIKLQLDQAKYNDWVKKGAQPTDRVKSLVKGAAQNA